MLGFSEGYDEWLNSYLEIEEPLSDIVLELSFCTLDVNKTISLLHRYCEEQKFDKGAVADRLRLFFKEAYYSNRMSKEEIISSMHRLALNIGDPGNCDFDWWESMYYLDYYCSLAEDNIISKERFDAAFFSYLDNGTPLDLNFIWNRNSDEKLSLLDRIKRMLKKK